MLTLSTEISKIRHACAKELEKAITQALIDLNFLQVKFRIAIQPKTEFSAKGMDDVEFMISTNPGEEVRSLQKAASGGELSRIMLAIKAVLAQHDDAGLITRSEANLRMLARAKEYGRAFEVQGVLDDWMHILRFF